MRGAVLNWIARSSPVCLRTRSANARRPGSTAPADRTLICAACVVAAMPPTVMAMISFRCVPSSERPHADEPPVQPEPEHGPRDDADDDGERIARPASPADRPCPRATIAAPRRRVVRDGPDEERCRTARRRRACRSRAGARTPRAWCRAPSDGRAPPSSACRACCRRRSGRTPAAPAARRRDASTAAASTGRPATAAPGRSPRRSARSPTSDDQRVEALPAPRRPCARSARCASRRRRCAPSGRPETARVRRSSSGHRGGLDVKIAEWRQRAARGVRAASYRQTRAHDQPIHPATRFGSGKSVRRVEDDSLLTGRDQFADNFSLPGQALSRLPALAARARAHRRARRGSGRGRCRASSRVYTGDDLVARRREAASCSRPTSSARTARRPPRRRSTRWRWTSCATSARPWPRSSRRRASRRATPRRRSTCATSRCRWSPISPTRSAQGAPLVWPDADRQRRVRDAARQRRGGHARDGGGRARGDARPRQPAARAGADRAARDARELRRRDRSHHAARELPDADRPARRAVQRGARHCAATRCACWSATSAAASA